MFTGLIIWNGYYAFIARYEEWYFYTFI
jgi:hypothetical protein